MIARGKNEISQQYAIVEYPQFPLERAHPPEPVTSQLPTRQTHASTCIQLRLTTLYTSDKPSMIPPCALRCDVVATIVFQDIPRWLRDVAACGHGLSVTRHTYTANLSQTKQRPTALSHSIFIHPFIYATAVGYEAGYNFKQVLHLLGEPASSSSDYSNADGISSTNF